jgi:hypothetical protein
VKQDHPRQARDIGQDTLQDRPQDALDRISVAQAATRLGITQDAVRKRIARGTIRHGKDHEGHIFVYLDTFESESKTVQDAEQDKYTRSLEDQIDFLRRELERKDTIIMSLTQRIPELEASPETREGHVMASEEADESTAPQEQQEPSQRRSWLYRFFYGPQN